MFAAAEESLVIARRLVCYNENGGEGVVDGWKMANSIVRRRSPFVDSHRPTSVPRAKWRWLKVDRVPMPWGRGVGW